MANDTLLTIRGNLVADPELRFTPSGAPVANFTIASTPRTFDRQANEWRDGETLFMRCAAWRDLAENVAETLTKGSGVIAEGYLKARAYQDREGNNRTAWELDVQDVGPSLRRQVAKVAKSTRGQSGGQQGGGFGGQGGTSGGFGGPPASASTGGGFGGQQGGQSQDGQDPWGGGGWDAPSSGEPAF